MSAKRTDPIRNVRVLFFNVENDNNSAIELQKIDSELSKQIEISAKSIEKNKNDALKNIDIQIQEIVKLTLSKLTNINISNQEIENTIQSIQNKMVN